MNFSKYSRGICLAAIIICAFLWFAAPFIAVNLLTLGDQPTGLQFITDDIDYIGEMTESPTFWCTVAALIGIVICFILIILKKTRGTLIAALLTEIALMVAFVNAFNWVVLDEEEDLFDAFGAGFWGIAILILIVILLSGSDEHKAHDT